MNKTKIVVDLEQLSIDEVLQAHHELNDAIRCLINGLLDTSISSTTTLYNWDHRRKISDKRVSNDR